MYKDGCGRHNKLSSMFHFPFFLLVIEPPTLPWTVAAESLTARWGRVAKFWPLD